MFLFKINGPLPNQILKILTIFIVVLFLTLFSSSILRHRSFFKRTLKFGIANHSGNYDWGTIIKNKTDLELQEIIRKQSGLPETVVELAKTELEERNKNK